MRNQSTPRPRQPAYRQPFVSICPVCGRPFYALPKPGARGATKLCSRACWKATLPLPTERFWSKVARTAPDDCWLWQATHHPRGYGTLWWQGRPNWLAHRVAWELTYGPIPAGMNVLHRCDVPACCNPRHLFLGTIADNNRDMAAKGRHWTQQDPERAGKQIARHRGDLRGTRHHQAKVTEDDVRAIRRRVAAGEWRYRVAADYGLTGSTVGRIVARRLWRHVE